MLRGLCLSLLLLPSLASGQQCTTHVLVSAYDQLTKFEIETLKLDDFDARSGHAPLAILSADRDFPNRVLVLLEVDGAAKSDKLENVVEVVTQWARTAPDGKPVAFGIYSDHAVLTEDFFSRADRRTNAVDRVVEQTNSLGGRVALWDSLHEALKMFGPHQPGDTVLLVGDPYDDKSHHSGDEVEREFIASGTRLFLMRRMAASHVDRDFTWKSHEFEKTVLDRTVLETGGFMGEFSPPFVRFTWEGYMLAIKVPENAARHRPKWKLGFRGGAALVHKKTNFYYPELLPVCDTPQVSVR